MRLRERFPRGDVRALRGSPLHLSSAVLAERVPPDGCVPGAVAARLRVAAAAVAARLLAALAAAAFTFAVTLAFSFFFGKFKCSMDVFHDAWLDHISMCVEGVSEIFELGKCSSHKTGSNPRGL